MPAFSPSKPFTLARPGESYSSPGKTSDFLRNLMRSMFQIGGIYCHIYKLEGHFEQERDELNVKNDEAGTTSEGTDIASLLTIQDPILGEIRDRKYNLDEVPVIKGVYQISDSEMELLRFGFKSNETLSMEFLQVQVEESLGRRFIQGDVIELPHLRETSHDGRSANRWYEVKSITWSPSGVDPMYQRHVVGVILQPLRHQQEFLDLFNNVKDEYGKTLEEQTSNKEHLMNVTEAIQQKSIEHVSMAGVDVSLMWFNPDFPDRLPVLWSNHSEKPPEGIPVNQGDEFPPNPEDGEWYLRTDLYPNRLFQFSKKWTASKINTRPIGVETKEVSELPTDDAGDADPSEVGEYVFLKLNPEGSRKKLYKFSSKWIARAVDNDKKWQPYNFVPKLKEFMEENDGVELKSIQDAVTDRTKRSDPTN